MMVCRLVSLPESMRKLGIAEVAFRDLKGAPIIEHVIAWRPGNLNPALWSMAPTLIGQPPCRASA
jgi:hypothetical protein